MEFKSHTTALDPFKDSLFLFWASLVISIVLTVVATMKGDLRWLLWVALLVSIVPILHIANNIGNRNYSLEIFCFFFVPLCYGTYVLQQWLDPALSRATNQTSANSITKPHIAMVPRIEMIETQSSIGVMFHNSGREDVDKLTLSISYSVNGHEQPEEKKELPILRSGTNRVFSILIRQQAYDAVISGTMSLKLSASVSYSFRGKAYTESCVTTWSSLAHRFDYTGC